MIEEPLRPGERRIGVDAAYGAFLADSNNTIALNYIEIEVSSSRDLAISRGEQRHAQHPANPCARD